MTYQLSNTRLLAFLRTQCQLNPISLNPELGFEFDAVLGGSDPLSIIVIEKKQSADFKTLRQVSRKIQSFAWSLNAQRKHNLITLLLLLPEIPTGRELHRALNDLNGSARVFLLSETMSSEDMEMILRPLSAPAFPISHRETIGLTQLQDLLGGIEAAEILDLSRSSRSDDELKSKLNTHLQQLAAEVRDALKKSSSN